MLLDIPFAMNDVITDQFISKLHDILILMFCYHATDIASVIPMFFENLED